MTCSKQSVIFVIVGGKLDDPSDRIASAPDPNAPIMLQGTGEWAFPFKIIFIDHINRSGPNHPHDVTPDFITLDSFNAKAKENGQVVIEWITGIERNNAGFQVWRANPLNGECSEDTSNYVNVKAVTPLIDSEGTEVSGATYNYTDSGLTAGETYCYALADIEFDSEEPSFHLDQAAKVIAR